MDLLRNIKDFFVPPEDGDDEMYDENSVLVMHLAEILSQPEYSDNIYLNYFVELLDNYM